MDRRRPPQTEEGWYVLHDFRSIDWNAWNDAPARRRHEAVAEGIDYLRSCEELSVTHGQGGESTVADGNGEDTASGDDDERPGDSAAYEVFGHKADLLLLHIRPSPADLGVLERQFERTALASYTERVDSYLSVTEVSGYMSEEFFEGEEVENPGMARYINYRLHPDIPDAEYVTFYPMDKRRGPEWNWYDLSFDERADYMATHGEIGKQYAGRVTQIISGSIGFDDHEWGVTLFANDPTDVKELLYEMRFDPSSSRFAEFGRFLFGRRLLPETLGTYLAGELVPQTVTDSHRDSINADHATGRGRRWGPAHGHDGERGHPASESKEHHHGEDATSDDESTDTRPVSTDDEDATDLRGELEDLGVYAGKPHGEDVHAVVLYSTADVDDLFEEVSGLRRNFDHYDTHVKTAVYAPRDESGGAETAVVSLWETVRAAKTAAGFLAELPDVVRQAGDEGDDDDSWGTMGMFYAVKEDSREDFLETFDEVGAVLEGMDGHRQSDLLVNYEDDCDTFIASRWDSREDAMAFFRSDAFADTVEWGRDILVDRPRHVFLA